MPCDYKKYPANWKDIRKRILEREGYRCKTCMLPNYAIGYRDASGKWHPIECSMQGDVDAEDAREAGFKVIKIVLTVAHIDHDITNNQDENLAAFCQLHHLRHDIQHHKANSRETNRKKKGLQNMF